MITLRETREQKVGSLSKLAEKSDLSASAIWEIETGRVTPTFGSVNKLCDALEVLPRHRVQLSLARQMGQVDGVFFQ